MSRIARLFLCIVPLSLLSIPVHATDGVVLINQATVLASGGFPYTITQPGSYRLSGDLVATAGADAIDINASNVTLDLNGFAIIGPASVPQKNAVSTNTDTPIYGVSVRNGNIFNFFTAIYLGNCSVCSVQQVLISGCYDGINVQGSAAFISGNVIGITETGIRAPYSSTVSGNTVFGNLANQGGLAVGIYAQCPVNLLGNTALNNFLGNIVQVGSGCNLANNLAP